MVTVDFSKRLRHRIAYADQKTPTRRARPRGVIGAEVWVAVSEPRPSGSGVQVPQASRTNFHSKDPPVGPRDFKFLQLSSRTPALVEYGGDDAGKTAHYVLRWVSSRGETGPWSEKASATIAA